MEQVLSYDVAEAEAVFGRPFDDEMDSEMRMAMYSADRIWLGETMWKVASATSYVLDGKYIRTAKIEHCDERRPRRGPALRPPPQRQLPNFANAG